MGNMEEARTLVCTVKGTRKRDEWLKRTPQENPDGKTTWYTSEPQGKDEYKIFLVTAEANSSGS